MTRRHPYDREKDDLADQVQATAAEGSLEEVLARVNAFLAALREQGLHVGIAVGSGPHLCATCETPWPCKLVRGQVPSLR